MITKINYTDSSAFTLTGSPYTGYFNISNAGKAFVGQYTQDVELTPKSNYLSEYYINKSIFMDRFLFDSIRLPYSEREVLIGANEIVSAATLNTKLGLLQTNLIYLYSKLFLGNTDVPIGYLHTAGLSANSN